MGAAEDLNRNKRESEFEDFYTDEEVARLEGISLATLWNRISAGKNHPPYSGGRKSRRWPKELYNRWKLAKIQKEVG